MFLSLFGGAAFTFGYPATEIYPNEISGDSTSLGGIFLGYKNINTRNNMYGPLHAMPNFGLVTPTPKPNMSRTKTTSKTPTTAVPTPGTPWSGPRRSQLAKRAKEKFPLYEGFGPNNRKCYADELEKIVGKAACRRIKKQVDKHNAQLQKQWEAVNKVYKENHLKRVDIARFGTDAQCDALAQEIIILSNT